MHPWRACRTRFVKTIDVQKYNGGARLGGLAQHVRPAMLVEILKTRPLGVRTDGGKDAPTVPGAVFINPA